jgi:hypothetical protein
MEYYFYNHSIKFKSVLTEIINYPKRCRFVVEDYSNIDDILYLNPHDVNCNYDNDDDNDERNYDRNYYGRHDLDYDNHLFDNDDYDPDEKLYGFTDNWESYYDSIYN